MTKCYYCPRPARFVVHDKRECCACCSGHAAWRLGTSMMLGHHDCPEGLPDGPPARGTTFEHVTILEIAK